MPQRVSGGAFRRMMMAASSGYLMTLIDGHAKRRSQAPGSWGAYAQLVAQDPTMHALMYTLLFSFSRPMAMAVIPVLTVDGYFLCRDTAKYLGKVSPGLAAAVAAPVSGLVGKVVGDPNWSHGELQRRIPSWNALTEVMVGLAFLMEVLTPFRNVFATVLFWQFLRIKYMLSPYTKQAFGQLDAFLSSKLTGIPVIGKGYAAIRGLLSSMGAPPKPGQSSSRCSIM